MKVSLNWLNDFIDLSLDESDVDELVHQLTMLGLEVEQVERIERDLKGVVCARVDRIEAHPKADKLQLVSVEYGLEEPLRLVCGAPGVRTGMLVPLATLGARLPGLDNRPLKKARIRGVESCGMLLSEVELGLGDDHSGLLELDPGRWKPGDSLAEEFDCRDVVFEFEVTLNRGDALSIMGIARELAALRGVELKRPAAIPAEAVEGPGHQLKISIEDDCAEGGCPRYAGQVMDRVRVGPSPRWMADRLEAVGLRSINNVVDVTNYVMWETGHPLHAFDLRQLHGGEIRVRFAAEGERFVTLDGEERLLNAEHTLICDAERAVALGGIMGGLNSGIEDDTSEILLECAAFDPVNIRMGARRAGLASDSSRRFERGVDMENVPEVMERTAALMALVSGARAAGEVVDVQPRPLSRPPLRLRCARVNAVLGLELDQATVQRHLESLKIGCRPIEEGLLEVRAPSWRFDLEREIDLIEEVARVEGYEQIGVADNARVPLAPHLDPFGEFRDLAKRKVQELGCHQVSSYSMVDPRLLEKIDPDRPWLKVRNPLSEDLAALRNSLLPSMIQTALYNLNRRNDDLRLFEIDREFHPDPESDTGCREDQHLVLLLCGRRRPAGWDGVEIAYNFFDIKELSRSLLQSLNLDNYELLPYLDRAYSANSLAVQAGGKRIGQFGQLDPPLCEDLGTTEPLFVLDLDLQAAYQAARKDRRYQPFSRYPSVYRDLSVVTGEAVKAGELEETIRRAGGELVNEVRLFDLYRGAGIPEGCLSRSFKVCFTADDRSLSEAEVEPVFRKIIAELERVFKARLR